MLIFSWILGVHWETGLCYFLTWIYNDRSGGDKSPILRNLLVAALFAATQLGALDIAAGHNYQLNSDASRWIAILAAVVGTTMHVSDFYDMEGDKMTERMTVPLLIGEERASEITPNGRTCLC